MGQIYHLLSLLNSRIFDLSSRFWDDMVNILYRRVICIYDYSGWANVMSSTFTVYERTGLYANITWLHVVLWGYPVAL